MPRRKDSLTNPISALLGERVLLEKHGDKFIATSLKPRRRAKSSEAQKICQQNFREAVSYARRVLKDSKRKKVYERRLEGHRNANQAILAEYMMKESSNEQIQKRNIGKEQVQDYHEQKGMKVKISEHIASIELTFLEKLKFFFIWFLPLLDITFRMSLAEDGHTKLKQSKIFSTTGFLSFMLSGFLSVVFGLSDLESIVVWILFFGITYLLEKKFRRSQRSNG